MRRRTFFLCCLWFTKDAYYSNNLHLSFLFTEFFSMVPIARLPRRPTLCEVFKLRPRHDISFLWRTFGEIDAELLGKERWSLPSRKLLVSATTSQGSKPSIVAPEIYEIARKRLLLNQFAPILSLSTNHIYNTSFSTTRWITISCLLSPASSSSVIRIPFFGNLSRIICAKKYFFSRKNGKVYIYYLR